MKKLFFLALVAVLLTAVFAAEELAKKEDPKEGKEFTKIICKKKIKVSCRYISVCSKREDVCVSKVTRKHCKRWGEEKYYVDKKRCAKWDDKKNNQGTVCCLKYETYQEEKKRPKCELEELVEYCSKTVNKCVEHKLERTCYRKASPYRVVGPKTCPAGKVLKFVFDGKKTIKRTCVDKPATNPTTLTCYSNLDPHDRSFDGRTFEFQVAGDYKFLETDDKVILVHQRLHKYAGWSGTIGFAARVNGIDVVEYVGDKWLLNGHPLVPKTGVPIELPEGGSIVETVDANKRKTIEVFAPNGAKLVFFIYHSHSGVNYGNLMATIPSNLGVDDSICKGDNIPYFLKTTASGLFGVQAFKEFTDNDKLPEWKSEDQKRNAEIRCKDAGLTGALFKNCLIDYLLAGDAPGAKEKAVEREVEAMKEIKEVKKIKKPTKKQLGKPGKKTAKKKKAEKKAQKKAEKKAQKKAEKKAAKQQKKVLTKAAVKAVKAAVKALPAGTSKKATRQAIKAAVKAAIAQAPKSVQKQIARVAAKAGVRAAKRK